MDEFNQEEVKKPVETYTDGLDMLQNSLNKEPEKHKENKVKGIIITIAIIALVVIVGAFAFYKVNLGPATKESTIIAYEIKAGDSVDGVIKSLKEKGLIKNELVAKIYVKLNGLSNIKVGLFDLDASKDTPTILKTLNDSSAANTDSVLITIPEGKWAKDIAKEISNKTNLSEEELLEAWNDEAYIKTLQKDYPFISNEVFNKAYRVKLEGYLFPNSYQVDKTTTVDKVTRTFLNGNKAVYDEFAKDIKASGKTYHEVLTFASVVQYESATVADMNKIAGVFENRFKINMRMESSVTLCYALYNYDKWEECEHAHQIDSPYNTYLNDGLPIGPILNPGKDAINAVLHPEKSDYLFFVADIYGDKTVYYFKTFEEHDKKAAELLPYYKEG
ncbi:MAG: endolytic transglycosylase MltG [Erysipelotrichaceae bacterium]